MERSGDNGEGYESHDSHLQGFVGGDTRGSIVRHTDLHFSVTKMEVGRDVVGGLSSKSKKRELVVGDA